MGRAIALLGIAQIPLGMTLYGSPKYLFILYAVVVFGWLLLYFILTYINRPVIGDDGYGTESYVSGPTRTEITEDRRTGRSNNHAVRNTALFGAGLAGLSAFRRRSRTRSRRRDDQVTDISRTNRTDVSPSRRSRTNRTDVSPSRRGSRHSVAYTEDEKYLSHNRPQRNNTWRNRLLGAGAGLGAYAGFKRLFGRSKARDEESDVSSYRAPSASYINNRADVERVQQGEAPMSPGDSRVSRPNVTAAAMASPTRQPLRPRRSRESLSSDDSHDSYESDFEQRHNNGGHAVQKGAATLGVLGFFKEKQRQRREKKEQRRVDEMRRREQENADNINRANSHRYTDRPYNTGRRRPSRAETLASEDYGVTGSNPELSRISRPESNNLPLPASAAAMPLPGPDTVHHDSSTAYLGYNPDTGLGPVPNTHQHAPATTAYPVSPGAVIMPSGAVEPDPSRLVQQPYQDSRTHLPQGVPIVAAAAAAANPPYSPAQSSYRPRPQSQQGRRNSASHAGVGESPESVASPPVSVKVQMHKDGRHVTLRRLNEEEAAAERDARKQERRQRRRRAESLSSGVEDEGTRFRRNMGAGSATNVPIANVPRPPSSRADELNLPPVASAPPPVPHHSLSPQGPGMHPSHIASSGMTSGIGSGGYDTGTGTDLDAFNENRRRRRAERAAAKQQRAAQSGQGARVEFS